MVDVQYYMNFTGIGPSDSQFLKVIFCLWKKVLVAQSCPTLCNPMNCSLPGFSACEILQARILGWIAIPFSKGSSRPGIKPRSPILLADSLPSESPRKSIYLCFLVTSVMSDSVQPCSLPGFSVHGILQAKVVEWVAVPSSRRFSLPRDQTQVSCVAGRFLTTEPIGKPRPIYSCY